MNIDNNIYFSKKKIVQKITDPYEPNFVILRTAFEYWLGLSSIFAVIP